MRGAGAALYPPRGTRRSGRGGLLSLTPLRAPGNQTLRQRGRLSLKPSARLDLSHPRPPFLRGPPGPPRGTPTRPLGEPGHPTLKPGSLTRPNRALRRTVPLVTPGEIYHWSPLIDLGFGRLASAFQGEPGVSPCPPSALPSRGTPLRSRPRCFPRHWSPLIDLGFVRLVSDFQGEAGVALCPPSALPSRGTPLRTFPRHRSPRIDLGFGRPSAPAPGTPRGRTEAARVGLLLGRQKLGSRDDFQWIAASELLCHAQNPDPESGRLRVI